MKCPRCLHDNPPQGKFCLECATPVDDTSPSPRSYADLKRAIEGLTHSLNEAAEQQAATSEILRVISGSPTDVQPVFDAIAERAMRLCDANQGLVGTFDGERIHLRAVANFDASGAEAMRRVFPIRATQGSVLGRTVLTKGIVHIPSMLDDPEYQLNSLAEAAGFRSALGVPMLKDGNVVGAVAVTSPAPRVFADREIALLQTFADQAVIAIENARLFGELQDKARALAEAHAQTTETLEQQTATSDILKVIARSPTDTQPVFATIAENAARLCAARDAQVLQVDGDVLRLVSAYGVPSMPSVRSISRGHAVGRAVIERQTIHVRDMAQAIAEFPETTAPQHGVQSVLAVPLVRHHVAVGVIRVSRTEIRPFTEAQIALLQTFADQAVIAIENVRLFNETKDALERQTATAEVLRVLSGSPTDVQPVMQTIVDSVIRLADADDAMIGRAEGDQIRWLAAAGTQPGPLQPISRSLPSGRAILDRRTSQVNDISVYGDEFPAVAAAYRQGVRTILATPLLREGDSVGVVLVRRKTVRPFTDQQIALLKTFADQAVIALENVRLFKELEARTAALTRSVDQLTALAEVGRAVSSTLDLAAVLTTIVSRAVELSGLDGGVVLEYDHDEEEFVHRAQAETGGPLAAVRRGTRIRKGEGVVGRTAITLEPIQVPDITAPGAYVGPNRENLIEAGVRAILAVPMVREGQLIGCLGVTRNQPGDFRTKTIELLRTFTTQSALAIQNARLYQEIENKSRQLEAASQHKSEFLANMSHELRTPLNAIIGFSELLAERLYGELNEKQDEYLKDIHASGQHLLSLINDILDLSKIEAGRMELELTEFDLPTAIVNALTLVRERAGRRGIALHQIMDQQLGQVRGDERKIKQVLLNLLSNALKFTPEGGRIDVRAGLVNRMAEISVADTGVGIASEDQEAIFEEFRQVGTADKKVEGTGLGLALSRKFVELHGGRIWVESQVGVGSTFTFAIPVRRDEGFP